MAYLGLVSSEDCSGSKRRLGSITKAGIARELAGFLWAICKLAQAIPVIPVLTTRTSAQRCHWGSSPHLHQSLGATPGSPAVKDVLDNALPKSRPILARKPA